MTEVVVRATRTLSLSPEEVSHASADDSVEFGALRLQSHIRRQRDWAA